MDTLALHRPPRFIAGLDVGKINDPTALIVMEREMHYDGGHLEPYFFVGWLEQLPLQMPYPTMVTYVKERLEKIGERCALVIDATGVGQGVVDLFRQGWTTYDRVEQQLVTAPGKPTVIAVTLTHGEKAHHDRWDVWSMPKFDIIMNLVVTLQQRRIEAAAGLALFETLVTEAQNYQPAFKKTRDGDPYVDWRSGQHDDLLLALAIAVWWGELYSPKTPPGEGQTQYAKPTGNVYKAMVSSRGRR